MHDEGKPEIKTGNSGNYYFRMRRGAAQPPATTKRAARAIPVRAALFQLWETAKTRICRKIPDIYSFVTMGMIMGLRLVVL